MRKINKYLIIMLLFCVVAFQLAAQQMYAYRYWFDSDISLAQIDSSASPRLSLELDVTDLSDGMHQLNVQVTDTSGRYSPTRTALFWKQMPRVEAGTDEYAMRYWFDDSPQYEALSEVSGVQMIDVSTLTDGMHTLHFQLAGNDGRYSPVRTALFWKQQPTALQSYVCKVFVNEVLSSTQALSQSNELMQLEIDTENMPYGMNTVRVQIENAQGEPLTLVQRFFLKPRVEMVRYEYWVNNDTASMSVVPTPLRDTIHVARMVDVDSYPFSSKSFNFEMEDGQPYVYAKNHLHVKFYNAYGAYVEDSRSYSDLSSKTKVKKMPFLASGVKQVSATPSENDITWYRVEADGRNEVQIAADQPCDVQLFAADGTCLFETSGPEICDTMSFRVNDAGDYYLALHDVTGQAENTTVYYHNSDSLYDAQGLIYALNATRDAFEVIAYADTLRSGVIIPNSFHGLLVTAIAPGALAGAGHLRSIEIPSSIQTVGEGAFSECYNLLTIEWNSPAALRAACFDEPEAYGNMLVFCKTADPAAAETKAAAEPAGQAAADELFAGNVVIDGVAENIRLTDGRAFSNPRNFTAKNITYSRYFGKQSQPGQSAGWEAMVLPFDVQSIVNEEKACRLAPFGLADYVQIMPMWVSVWNASGNAFEACTLPKANVPFIAQVPNNEVYYEERFNMSGTIVFSAEQTTVLSTHLLQTTAGDADYQFLPAYEAIAPAANVYALNDNYYSVDGEVFASGGVFVSGLREIRPFEAYIQKSAASTQQASYLRIGGEVTTGMESIMQAHLPWPQEDVWYNLQGIRLPSRPKLPGLYIHNGEKVLVK